VNLTTLIISNNNFSSSLPASLLDLAKLHTFRLGANLFSGDMLDFSGSTMLRNFTFPGNDFEGILPDLSQVTTEW
jgi:hypothetical protein